MSADRIIDRRTWLAAGRLHRRWKSLQGRDPTSNDGGAEHEQLGPNDPSPWHQPLHDCDDRRSSGAKPVGGQALWNHDKRDEL